MNRPSNATLVCALFALLSLGWIASNAFTSTANARSSQQEATPGPKPLMPFVDGKIVTVVTDLTGEDGMYLEEVELRQLGSEWFLTGKFARFGRAEENGIDGLKRVWVPMSSVKQLYEYENKEALNFGDETKA
ncbi:MAG: hypothetical protein ACK5OB_03510 [Pirellula sp.]